MMVNWINPSVLQYILDDLLERGFADTVVPLIIEKNIVKAFKRISKYRRKDKICNSDIVNEIIKLERESLKLGDDDNFPDFYLNESEIYE